MANELKSHEAKSQIASSLSSKAAEYFANTQEQNDYVIQAQRESVDAVVEEIELQIAADTLGYETISWDAENSCYSGYGSDDAFDRSRDDVGGLYVADTLDEVIRMAE